MKTRRQQYFLFFAFFLLLTLVIVVISRTPLFSFLEKPVDFVILPVQRVAYTLTALPFGASSPTHENENASLRKQLLNQQLLLTENAALKDQFQTSSPSPTSILPATIIGSPEYVPGITAPTIFILDKGKTDGVRVGQAVVVKKDIVGIVSKVSDFRCVVLLMSNPEVTLTAKSLSLDQKEAGQSANGIVKGTGEATFLFDNVLVSESLRVSDMVVTKGDVQTDGTGVPPELVVGKIISVDKKPSALFQKAVVESLLDFSKLHTVFVMIGV